MYDDDNTKIVPKQANQKKYMLLNQKSYFNIQYVVLGLGRN